MLVNPSAPPAYEEEHPTAYQDRVTPPVPPSNEKALAPSTSRSAISLSCQPNSLLGGRTLTFHHASFPWRSVNITRPSTAQPAYYAEISEATRGKPDILLRSPDSNGASVGRAHFQLSRSMRIGLGRDELDEKMQWVEFKTSSLFSKGAFDFEYGRHSYRLTRTHAKEHGVEGAMQKMNLGHFKVVDVETAARGEGDGVVAVYVSETYHPGWMKGTLTLGEGVDAELEVLIVLGVVGWREKMRRRAAYSGSGGSANGGG